MKKAIQVNARQATDQQAQHQDPTPEAAIRIVKTIECDSVSGKSRLTYEFGVRAGREVCLRIAKNSGTGMFSNGWVPMDSVLHVLRDPRYQESIGSVAFRPLFLGKSINTQSFVFAALKNEEVVMVHPSKLRSYQVIDVDGFEVRLNDLLNCEGTLGCDPINLEPTILPSPSKKGVTKPAIKGT